MLPLLLLILTVPSVWCIAITVPSTVVTGEDLDFSWSGAVSPYVLKILINNKVVSQNNDWTATSNSWTASPDTAPVGSIIKIRVIDSENNMVISTGTEVVETNAHTDQGSINTVFTATRTTSNSGHHSTSAHDGSMTFDSFDMGQATVTNNFADDPAATGGMGSTSVGGSNSTLGGQDELGASGMGSNSSAAMMATSTSAVAIASAATSLAVATGATAGATSALDLSADTSITATGSAASSTSTSADSSSSTSTSTYIIIAAVVLTLACVIGGGVWWYLHSPKQKDPQQGEKGGHGQDHSDEEALVGGGHGHGDSETDQSEDEGVGKPKNGGSGGGKGGHSETETEPSESEDDGKSRRRD